MKQGVSICLGIGLLLSTFGLVQAQQCTDSSQCPPGEWCNADGWCEGHYDRPGGAGLQGRCGPNFFHIPCPLGQSCNDLGWCVPGPVASGVHIDSASSKASHPSQVHQSAIIQSCVSPGMWAFTLDDGPDPSITPAILDILQEEGVVVTFFVVGYSLEGHPTGASILQRAHAAGHQIGSHTYNHLALTSLGDYELSQQMQKTNAAIKKVIGVEPVFMRPPYGDYNEHVLQVLNREKYVAVNWNMVSNDCIHNWETCSDWKVLQQYQTAASQAPGAHSVISLAHDIQGITLRTLRQVIKMIKAGGYRFVRMDECLGFKYPAYR